MRSCSLAWRTARHRAPLISQTARAITYINPNNQATRVASLEEEEQAADDALTIRQLNTNARTLVRARRHGDAEKLIDEGLSMFPWQSSLWFWKIATKIGNSRGAIEVWDNMTRMGVRKLPEHYDIMANAVCYTDARHMVIELYWELKEQDMVGNTKFYIQLFQACERQALLTPRSAEVWQDMLSTPNLQHLTQNPDISYFHVASRPLTHQPSTPIERVTRSDNADPVVFNSQATANEPPASESSIETTEVPSVSASARTTLQSTHHAESTELKATNPIEQLSTPISLESTSAQGSVEDSAPLVNSIQERVIPQSDSPLLPLAAPIPPPQARTSSLLQKTRNDLEKFFDNSAVINEHKKSLGTARDLVRDTAFVDIETYNYVIRSAARVEKSAVLMEILEEAIERGLRPDTRTYNPIIRHLFRHEKPDEALDLIDRMELSNVKFDFSTVNEVLRGLLRNGRDDAAISFFVDVFQSESDLSLSPGKDGETNSFAIMINGLADCGRLEDAQKLLSIMLERDLQPSLTIYTALIRVAFSQRLTVEAMGYYDLAIKTPDLERININYKEDLDELASAVVSGFLSSEHAIEAEAFMSNAAQLKRWHNTTPKPYIAFIHWLARQERIEDALELFKFHKNDYDSYDTFKLYCSVLKAVYLQRGDIFGGLRWFKEMKERSLVLDQSPYADLIGAAMLNGERDIGEQVWEDAVQYVKSSGKSFSRLLLREGERWHLRIEGGSTK